MTTSKKNDADKPQLVLVSPWFVEDMARGLTHGEDKYTGDRHWLAGTPIPAPQLISAIKRHVAAIEKGEWLDGESGGVPHAALAADGLMMLHEYERRGWHYDLRYREQFHASPGGQALQDLHTHTQRGVSRESSEKERLDMPNMLTREEAPTCQK